MKAIGWNILVVGALLLFFLYRAYSRSHTSNSAPIDPNVGMPEMADRAVRYAAEHGQTLDYTPGSIKIVEVLLGELHDLRAKNQLSDHEVNLQALHFGGYVGEVIRRKFGGTWSTDHSVAGPNSFPIHWNGHDSFPIAWCGKRVLNGDEDNVWFKFQVLTSDAYQGGAITRPGSATTSAGMK